MAIPISTYPVDETSDEDDRDDSVSDSPELQNRPQAEEQASDTPQRSSASQQTDPQGQEPPRIRLVFQGQQSYEERGPLLALARTIGLDVWGNYLLNRRAAREMGSAALLLFVVLTFELLAWTLLFNVLVHSAQWRVSGLTLIALTLGGVFAAGVFLFEKSFITADFTEGTARKVGAYIIRFLIIAGSALATAQPIELLVFGGAIETRLHEENVLAEAVRQVEDFKKLETKAQQKTEGQLQQELSDTQQSIELQTAKQERNATKLRIVELEQEVPRARAALQAASDRVQRWQSSVNSAYARVNRAATPEDREAAQRALSGARANLAAAQSRRSTAQARLGALEEELRDARTRLGLQEGQVADTQKAWGDLLGNRRREETARVRVSEVALEKLKEWIKTVQSAAPGKPITNPDTQRVLHPKPADFTDRLRILDDLRHGKPALWPPSSEAVRSDAVQLFGLEDPTGPETPAKAKMRQRLEQNATLFGRIYWVAFLMASVIPLLTVAFKLMMAGELRDYYSTDAQARAGNPAAIQVIRARGQRLQDLFPSGRPAGDRENDEESY